MLLRIATVFLFVFGCLSVSVEKAFAQSADLKKTIKYLDKKQDHWFQWRTSKRGDTRCTACHTNLTYALARHELASSTGETGSIKAFDEHLLANASKRVENWDRIRVFYGGRKEAQSRGTEAIMNALVFAKHDRAAKRTKISKTTKKAFQILWKHQIQSGEHKGGWHWLDFGLEPWESEDAAYYGASLAAIAVATAPGYAKESEVQTNLDSLRSYLMKPYGDSPSGDEKLSLYNRTYLLWASSELDGLLDLKQKAALIKTLLEKQNSDGGWALPTLGAWTRLDGTEQAKQSDGYATGLVVYAILRSGFDKEDKKIKSAIAWLNKNQQSDGSWAGISVNKNRERAREPVKSFFTHAATAMSAMAIIESKK